MQWMPRWIASARPGSSRKRTTLNWVRVMPGSMQVARTAVPKLIRFDETGVTFRYKDYRRDGADRQQVMTLAADEFIRRFLLHVLPRGFHRIRHYGLLAGASRQANLDCARELLAVALPVDDDASEEPLDSRPPCPCCGGRMVVIETFARWHQPRAPPSGITPTGRKAP